MMEARAMFVCGSMTDRLSWLGADLGTVVCRDACRSARKDTSSERD